MKKIIFITSVIILSFCNLKAQTNIPNSINLQAIARDANGNIVQNANIYVRLTFYNGPLPSTMLVLKVYLAATDDFGQFQVNIDNGGTTTSGTVNNVSEIDWSTGNIYVLLEYQDNIAPTFTVIDTVKAGTTFYAFASRTAEELKTPGSDGQVLKYNGTTNKWEADVDNDTQYIGSSTININGSNSISVAPNSIGTTQLSITSLPPNGPAGGVLGGNYPNPTLNNNTVGSAQIIDNSITTNDIASGVIPTAGAGITINGSNQIVATDPSITNELPVAGAGISVSGNTVSVKSVNDYAVFEESYPAGTLSAFPCNIGNQWYVRILNSTPTINGSAINRVGNNITLQSGVYLIRAYGIAYKVGYHQLCLKETLSGNVALSGTSETIINDNSMPITSKSIVEGILTVSSNPTTYYLDHYVETTVPGSLGKPGPSSITPNEVFTRIIIQKIQ